MSRILATEHGPEYTGQLNSPNPETRMSNGWIPMPLNALSFALQLANIAAPPPTRLSRDMPPPEPVLEFEGLTDEVARYFLMAPDDETRLAA